MKIGFITMEWADNREYDSLGSSRIRCRWVWETWKNVFPEDDVEQFHIGKQYDVLIFQKVYWEPMLEKFNGIKIVDLCDPDWLEGRNVMKFISMADAVTTSTQALADYIKKFVKDKPVICIPDRCYFKELTPRPKHEGKARIISWTGYHQNFHYIYPTLELLKEHNLELYVIADQQYTPPTGFDVVKITNFDYKYPQVNDIIKKTDLYLAPQRNDQRGKFKSNNKEIHAMALGVPVVRLPDDLINLADGEARNQQVEKDLQEVHEKWNVEESCREYKALIDEISKAKVSKM